MSSLKKYQEDLIEGSLTAGALKFGSFVLKSGRISPYFFNAGLLCTGSLVSTIASAYAAVIAAQALDFDVLFGPAYKGIPLVAATALALHRDHGLDVAFAYDRKEAKDHGEGGVLVGAPVDGCRVLVLDDVVTAGTAVRGAMDLVKRAGGTVVGVVLALDREEVGPGGCSSIAELEQLVGGPGHVKTIVRMRELIAWLEKNGRQDEVASMQAYWNQYGVKE